MKNFNQTSISIAGREISFETGKIARQANGSVIVRSGDTMLLATACSADSVAEGADFLPLRVDYQEKFSSTGKTLGGFIKREGKPAEREILVCRLIDRPIRPMFPEGFYNEVQIQAYVLSYDGVHSPEPLAICAASAALVISDIPMIKPIAGVRVGLIDNQFVVNPTVEEMKKTRLDLILAGTEEAILMIEGFSDFLTEEQMLEAVALGHEAIKLICKKLSDWGREIGKTKKKPNLCLPSQELVNEVESLVKADLDSALRVTQKQDREKKINDIRIHLYDNLISKGHLKRDIAFAYSHLQYHLMREMILKEHRRCDGRKTDEIRSIEIETSVLPRTHGSALFTRGETQAIAVVTLGGETMAQRYEDLNGEDASRFYLQYFFPPFSVGEVGRVGPPGRREIGHGKLAERALLMTMPPKESFPYVIRLESNITESNGSSSMASVCGCCLAMMDAGIPIRHPISGIAMGLILEKDHFAILSDILGVEDALGDMDFKVAGDANGITAFQLDIKIEGINHEILRAALMQAKEGRLHILKKMVASLPKPKEHLSVYAPKIETLQIKPSKIGALIGPGGKQIRAIIEKTGADININDSGFVSITATTRESLEAAKECVINLTSDVEIGRVYTGRIVSVVPFGVFVEIFGKEGLCHISEIAHERIQDIHQVCKEGDMLEVKVIDINDRGQIKLSHKALLPPPTSGYADRRQEQGAAPTGASC